MPFVQEIKIIFERVLYLFDKKTIEHSIVPLPDCFVM